MSGNGTKCQTHLYGKQPARNLQHRSTAEVLGEQLDVDGGRHQDETQVRAFGQQGAQHPEQEVTVEVPLVDLIHNQHLVLVQRGVLLDLPQQQPLGQKQQLGGGGAGGLEADLVPHLPNRSPFYVLFSPFKFTLRDSKGLSDLIYYTRCQGPDPENFPHFRHSNQLNFYLRFLTKSCFR